MGGWSTSRPGRFIPGNEGQVHCAGGGRALDLVSMSPEILRPTGVRSPDRPARNHGMPVTGRA